MTTIFPVQQSKRSAIVDIVRGFALVGVLFANFTSYIEQIIPSSILSSISTPFDILISNFNSVFIEWKFMTIFSMLFGYGFGLIIESLEKKNINPNSFFIRRMFWLFIIGILHTLFWWGDVLHFYAISGIFLLAFRKSSKQTIFISSIFLMFIVTPFISFLFQGHPSYFTDQNMQLLYTDYKNGDILDVFKSNINFYYKAFVLSGSDLHDISETLGRFLFGYFLMCSKLFESVVNKKRIFRNVSFVTGPIMVVYFCIRWFSMQDLINIEKTYWEPLIKIGIISTSFFYVSILVILFINNSNSKIFFALQALGKMTLTNYLLVSATCISILYGIGFGQYEYFSLHIMWVSAFVLLLLEIIFSTYWLNIFRYGPTEWIWRQLTYKNTIPLRKENK